MALPPLKIIIKRIRESTEQWKDSKTIVEEVFYHSGFLELLAKLDLSLLLEVGQAHLGYFLLVGIRIKEVFAALFSSNAVILRVVLQLAQTQGFHQRRHIYTKSSP